MGINFMPFSNLILKGEITTDYTAALELKMEYLVYGSFYDLTIGNTGTIPCRNVLEIYRKDYLVEQSFDGSLFYGKPDAIFIMMNPGSSEPREFGYKIPKLSADALSDKLLKERLVKTKPDTTQYQVMRIMRAMQWNHVRVLNLSDMREAKSNLFITKIKALDNTIHSIFSSGRKKELEQALNVKYNAPIVCAWGVNSGLLNLANLCLQSIPQNRMVGMPCKVESLYYHPLPSLVSSQMEWLDKMIALLTIENPIAKVGG